jgi:hypothetical protein
VVLSFRDGEEVDAVLLSVDEVHDTLTYEVKAVLRAGSSRVTGTAVGATVVARLDDLSGFAAQA